MSSRCAGRRLSEAFSGRASAGAPGAFNFADDDLRLRLVQPAEFQELDQVNPALSRLALGDERLRLSEALGRLGLRHAGILACFLQKPKELLVGGGKGGLS